MADGTVRWYHGGFPGLKRGQQILPPSATGAVSITDKALGDDDLRERALKVHDPGLVYLTRDIADARFFASMAPAHGGKNRGGDVYEVTPDGPLVPDPDYLPQDGKVMACCSATIVRVAERRVSRPSAEAIAFLAATS